MRESPIVFDELAGAHKSLRLAVVTETWPPEVNGVAKTAARFVEGLRRRGHQIQLIRPKQSAGERSTPEEILVRGIAIPSYPDLKMGLPAKSALERLWSFRRPDVVHVVTEGPLGWSALQAAAKLKLPVVSDFRTNFHAYSGHYGVGWLKKPILAYLRKFHNRTLATMVPTEAMRADLSAHGFQRLRVIARGVDTALFDPARRDERLRASWGAGPSDLVLLYVGRLAAEKNLPAALSAYEKAGPVKLVLVGDGPMRRELQARYPDAVFAGTRSGEDLAAHYASGDVFLFPSLTETWGNVTLEAMASGLAVVAFDYAAAAEVVRHGASGLLVPFHDEASFVDQAAALAADAARARRLGQAARVAAEGRGWDHVVRELESVLFAAADTGRITLQQGAPGRASDAEAVMHQVA
ncbi:MAG TPA: glycosyltransferase family 1 protein [Burkholderiales bacterium]|nr:glycosyltransferase family 1 protein [Burkholderiales bacterium]